MRIEHSPAVQLVLSKAIAVAFHAGAGQIAPAHVLQALLDDDEGHAAQLVRRAGVDGDKLRGLVPACVASADGPADLPWSAGLARILAQARELTRLHGAEGSLTSEHLLLALLEGDSSSRALLESAGLDFAVLKNQITPPPQPFELQAPLELGPERESIDVARALDASANRASEGLRVLEDYARFVRADRFLTERLKQLRHHLAEALARLPATLLLQGRDTPHDVGTSISTASERERGSLHDVVRANAKRVQEALRSLEEFGKVIDPSFGEEIERLRYESYTLDRALALATALTGRLAEARLYVLVTEAVCKTSLVGTVREALAGGAQVIQLREKDRCDREVLPLARDLREMTRAAGALFIANDRPDLALLAEADGVHLGQDDLPVHQVRRVLGADALIGVSTHDVGQVRRAVLDGANYIGVGPTFPSRSKAFEQFPGLDFVKQVAAETSLPAFVLGGVTEVNLPFVLTAGGRRAAVSHAVCAADDPKTAARLLRRLMDEAPL